LNKKNPIHAGRPASPRRRGLAISNWEGSFATVHIILTSGKFLTGYALALGATALHIGILNAIPYFFQGVQLVSAYVSNRLGRRKPLTLITSLISRRILRSRSAHSRGSISICSSLDLS